MKMLKKILLGLLFLIIIVALAGIIFIRYISHKALPGYSGEINLKGITEEVVVFRDSLAIPHIYAQNENDLYIAVGYVMAQDRLWQMDLLRRATTGTLSEIFGDDLVEADWLLRALRIPEKSEIVINNSDKH